MGNKFSAVLLSSEEVELISIFRSIKEQGSKSTLTELVRQFGYMDQQSRCKVAQSIMNIKGDYDRQQKISHAVEYGRRYSHGTVPKVQFGNLAIYATNNK